METWRVAWARWNNRIQLNFKYPNTQHNSKSRQTVDETANKTAMQLLGEIHEVQSYL